MNHPTPHITARQRRNQAGFLLNELLIALAIFAIGMAALASLFPVAAMLQRETLQEVTVNAAAQSAKAVIDSQGLTYRPGSPGTGDLGGYHGTNGDETNALSFYQIDPNLLQNDGKLPAALRSYPTLQLITDPNNPPPDFDAIANCDLFWVPFIQDLNGNEAGTQNWALRLFVLERDSRADYRRGGYGYGPGRHANYQDPDNFPKVVWHPCGVRGDKKAFTINNSAYNGVPTNEIKAGDLLMDSNGVDYVVTKVDGSEYTVDKLIPTSPATPGRVWHAPAGVGGSRSPTRAIVTLEVDVVNPQ